MNKEKRLNFFKKCIITFPTYGVGITGNHVFGVEAQFRKAK